MTTISNLVSRRLRQSLLVVLLGIAPGTLAQAQEPVPAVGAETLKATWSAMPGRVRDIAINAAAIAYAVGTDGVALRWRADAQKWAKMSGKFERITGAEDNHPWAITAEGIAMRFNGLWWEPKSDKVADVAGDALGNVYIARLDGTIQRWEPLSGNWRTVPGPRARRIALDIRGIPWVVATDGRILRMDGETWVPLPGKARDIAAGAKGVAAIVDTEGRVRALRTNPLRWVPYEGMKDTLAVALTPDGGPWAVLADGKVLATTLIVKQGHIDDEADDKKVPRAEVPHAAAIHAAPIVASKIQAGAVQAPHSSAPKPHAPEAATEAVTAPPVTGGGNGSGKSSAAAGTVSPAGRGGAVDPATTTTREELAFTDTRATASQVAIGRDGSVFALDTSGNISRWSNSRSEFDSFPGQLARLAVDSTGHPWGVTGLGRVFHHTGKAWVQIQGVTASDIAIGGQKDVVVITDAEGLLSRYNPKTGRFEHIDGLGVQVAVAPDGTPWTIRADNVVQRCARNPCTPAGHLARSLAIGPDGSIFLVDTNDRLLRKRPQDKSFSQVLVRGYTPAAVAVGPKGYPWLVTSGREVLASRFFPRDEAGDRLLAQRSSGDTAGSGGTASVVASESSSSFTFTKNLKFTQYKSSDPEANIGMLEGIHTGLTGAVYISGDSGVFKFNSKTQKFETLTKTFPVSSLADVGEDESGTLWGLDLVSPATVYRIKGTQVKSYTVVNNTDTPRNLSVTADGTVYVVAGAKLYKKDASSSVFKEILTSKSGDFLQIHVGPGGDIWILNQNSEVQQYTGSKFENRPKGTAQQAVDMDVGADGSVYVLDNSTYLLKKWNATNGRFDDVNITQQMHRVAVTIEGRPWIINTSGGLTKDIWRAKD